MGLLHGPTEITFYLRNAALIGLAFSSVLVFGKYASLSGRGDKEHQLREPTRINLQHLIVGLVTLFAGTICLIVWIKLPNPSLLWGGLEVLAGILFYGGIALTGLALLKVDPLKIISRQNKR
jgi:hypothetical protein